MAKFYLDTNIWIYHLEDTGERGLESGRLIKSIIDVDNTIVVSSLFFTEYFAGKSVDAKPGKLLSQMDAFRDIELEIVQPLNAIYAGELRQQYNLRTPDAIHLATAIRSGCETFWTGDKRLQKVKEIDVRLFA